MKENYNQFDRRQFLKKAGLGIGASALAATAAYPFAGLSSLVAKDEKNLGVALVGLGGYSKGKLLPAFEHTKYCHLAGIVTGSPDKKKEWMEAHNIPEKNTYNYENFDSIADNPDIDIVYVVLPNSMHGDFVIRAAEAGKHVICEKPFDISVKKSEMAVEACKKAGKLLQIGYRCQYDPYHLELMRIGREKELGDIKLIRTCDSFFGVNSSNWRFTDRKLAGGGALMDIGVYCIQGARYGSGEEPVAVRAVNYNTYPDKMDGMEETIIFTLEFPSGAVATCSASYAARADELHISAEKGNYGLKPGYGYATPQLYKGNETITYPAHNQQATQMDAFARNILDGTPVVASGEEGLQDMRIIEAIYKSAKKGGKRVTL